MKWRLIAATTAFFFFCVSSLFSLPLFIWIEPTFLFLGSCFLAWHTPFFFSPPPPPFFSFFDVCVCAAYVPFRPTRTDMLSSVYPEVELFCVVMVVKMVRFSSLPLSLFPPGSYWLYACLSYARLLAHVRQTHRRRLWQWMASRREKKKNGTRRTKGIIAVWVISVIGAPRCGSFRASFAFFFFLPPQRWVIPLFTLLSLVRLESLLG